MCYISYRDKHFCVGNLVTAEYTFKIQCYYRQKAVEFLGKVRKWMEFITGRKQWSVVFIHSFVDMSFSIPDKISGFCIVSSAMKLNTEMLNDHH